MFVGANRRIVRVLGLQKVGNFPGFWKLTGNFGNFLGFLEIYLDFWKVSGNLPEIFHPFATLSTTNEEHC